MLSIGHPTTWVYVDKASYESILDSVRAGMVTISESPRGPSYGTRQSTRIRD